MAFSAYFPIFDQLSAQEQTQLAQQAVLRRVPQGTLLHSGSEDCMGLLLVRNGQLRAVLTSDEGREITIYRLFERDICLFSASCILNSIQFDITIVSEKPTEFWLIPPAFYKSLMERSALVANYTNQIMASRFTDVMWLMEQILWKSNDRRLAQFLLEECRIEGTPVLKTTHETIANHLGTAREVVTRMLKYFQAEGLVRLTRGSIEILDAEKLESLNET